MTIQLTAFRWVPPFAQGFVRDLRVRWALEEAGLPYEAVLIDLDDRTAYRQWQPFGQVPAYRDDEVEMFESGAIVLHLAAKSEALSPSDPAGQARTASWVFAAVNSVEPHVQNLVSLDAFHAGESWIEARRPQAAAALHERLGGLSDWLGEKDYLEERLRAARAGRHRRLRSFPHPRRLYPPLRGAPGVRPGDGGADADVQGECAGVIGRLRPAPCRERRAIQKLGLLIG